MSTLRENNEYTERERTMSTLRENNEYTER